MADQTRRFRFTILNQTTDQVSVNNYKFTDGDRVFLDRLLRFAVENHSHNGGAVTMTRPVPATLTTFARDGALPGNSTLHYRYSIVDSRGQESVGSQVATIQTPSQATTPAYAPRLTRQAGVLDGGDYLYAVSAATNDSSQETLVGPVGAGTLVGFGGWHVDLPPMPSGGQFFNVYRKGPTDTELVFLFSTGPEDRWFVDDGDRRSDRFRTSPSANTTYMTNQIKVWLPPGAWPNGSWTWKLYRTFDPAQWDNSLLDWIGPTDTYTDDGRATRPGYPPDANAAVGGAPKIRLNTDTTGIPPASAAAGVTRTINFNADFVRVGPGTWHWVNEYEHAELQAMRATANRVNPPAIGDIQIGLDRFHDGTWVTIIDPYLSPEQPLVTTIPARQSIGNRVWLAQANGTLPKFLARGDRLRLHVHQALDSIELNHDLTLAVTLLVHDGLTNQSYTWETN